MGASLRVRLRLCAVLGLAALCAVIALGQGRSRVWARYEIEMQDAVDDPPDVDRKGEFSPGRLRYRSPMDRYGGRYFRWGIDVNKGDRILISILRRLTRIDTAPIESIVDVSSDEIFDHPWLLAGSVGDWVLQPEEARRLRRYFDRGGFLMVDDFHNDREWGNFMAGIHQIDPNAQVDELSDEDPVFHVVYNMDKRIRVPGANVVHGDQIERGGTIPHWRAIRDSRGRIMVAICFNMDVGDGWEFADDPEYPEKYASEAIRLGVNYVLYAMAH